MNLTFNKLNSKIKFGIFFFPFFFISIIALLRMLLGFESSEYIEIVKEDGPIEYVSAIILFCSAIFSGLITSYFLRTKQKLLGSIYVIVTLVIVFFAFEEISWGQRILGFETPIFLSTNLQGESNIHNLDFIQIHILTKIQILLGLIFGFSWIIFRKRKNKIYNLFVTFLIPKWYLMSYFIPLLGYWFIKIILKEFEYTNEIFFDYFIVQDQEIGELLYALAILFFMIINYFSNKPFNNIKLIK